MILLKFENLADPFVEELLFKYEKNIQHFHAFETRGR